MIHLDKPHYMIDLETTGLLPHKHGITSVGIAQFDPETFVIKNKLHAAIAVPVLRLIDPATMTFRAREQIAERERSIKNYWHYEAMLMHIRSFIADNGIVWAKPAKFDIAFLESYFADYGAGLLPPWHYRHVIDLASFIAGRGHNIKDLEARRKSSGEYGVHDALEDCRFQIDVLAAAHE